jgi:hypothetical protein
MTCSKYDGVNCNTLDDNISAFLVLMLRGFFLIVILNIVMQKVVIPSPIILGVIVMSVVHNFLTIIH